MSLMTPKATIQLRPRNYPQRSHQNDIRNRKHSQEQQCPFRAAFLEGDAGEIRRHGHRHQKRKAQPAHQNRIAFGAEQCERHRFRGRPSPMPFPAPQSAIASATIGNPNISIRADVATSVADATIVHTGS